MTNKFRGELKVKLNNQEYNTRLTLDGMMRIETSTGKPFLKLANNLMDANLSMTDMVTVMTQAIRGGGNDFDAKKVGELLYEGGITDAMRVTGEVLANAITGGEEKEEDEKNEKAVSKQTD